MDKYIRYISGFLKEEIFPFDCPECNRHSLFLKPDLWFENQTVASKKEMEKEYADYENFIKHFHAVYECCNKECGEKVFVAGVGILDLEHNDGNEPNEPEIIELYIPKFVQPSVNFFEMPVKTPNTVKESIKNAFEVVFYSRDFAANKMRTALEHLLTFNDIEIKDKKGSHLNLHARIEKIHTTNALYKFKDELLAIKWIGNAGSHGGREERISLDIILSQFKIMENILKEIYGDNKNLREIISKINKLRRPPTFWEKALGEWDKSNEIRENESD